MRPPRRPRDVTAVFIRVFQRPARVRRGDRLLRRTSRSEYTQSLPPRAPPPGRLPRSHGLSAPPSPSCRLAIPRVSPRRRRDWRLPRGTHTHTPSGASSSRFTSANAEVKYIEVFEQGVEVRLRAEGADLLEVRVVDVRVDAEEPGEDLAHDGLELGAGTPRRPRGGRAPRRPPGARPTRGGSRRTSARCTRWASSPARRPPSGTRTSPPPSSWNAASGVVDTASRTARRWR